MSTTARDSGAGAYSKTFVVGLGLVGLIEAVLSPG